MVNYSKRIIIVRAADLSDFSLIFFGIKVCFVSRSMRIVIFLRKNGDHPKLVVDFLWEGDTFRIKTMEIVEDVDEKRVTSTTEKKPGNRRRFCV